MGSLPGISTFNTNPDRRCEHHTNDQRWSVRGQASTGQLRRTKRRERLSIHSAIFGEVRPANIGGLRTGDESHHRRDLINLPVAAECCGGFLGYRPLAGCGIQIRVDWTRLNIVDRNTRHPSSLYNA